MTLGVTARTVIYLSAYHRLVIRPKLAPTEGLEPSAYWLTASPDHLDQLVGKLIHT
jgi:hypothetical protein